MGAVLAFTHQLETETCCKCGVEYAMPQSLQRARREDHQMFYCPNGHPQYFIGETDADKYKRLYEAEQRAVLAAKHQVRVENDARLAAEQKLAAERRRTGNGVCPCCSRSFQNLRRHMATKHPEHGPATTTKREARKDGDPLAARANAKTGVTSGEKAG
jgi:hypothetical protein